LLFGSNPEDFGVEGTDKDPIFDSLKSIAKLPSSPPKDNDRLDGSAIQSGESPATRKEESLVENPVAAITGK